MSPDTSAAAAVPSPADTASLVGRQATDRGRGYVAALLVCAILCLLPIWLFDYLPMVDLPQHAQQLAIWQHWDDPAYGYQQHLELNWRTPYLLPNALVYLLATVLPAITAFKVWISLAILAIPLATRRLLDESGGDSWWAFLAFPVGFSFSFYWGFFNFVLATPAALFFLLCAVRYSKEPNRARGLGIFLFLNILFVGHVLLFGLGGLIGGLLVLARARDWRVALTRLVPYLASLPVVLAWLVYTHDNEAGAREPTVWAYGLHRFPQLVTQVVGMQFGETALLAGAAFLLLPLMLGGRPSRDRARWIPLAIAIALFMVAPTKTLGTSALYPRFVVFVLPTWLYALDVGPRAIPRWRRVLAPALAATWLLSLLLKFWGFDQEMAGFRQVVDSMEPHRRVLYFQTPESTSSFLHYPVFAYSGVWYQVDHGGMVDFSFAEFFPARFKYRPESRPPLPPLFRWRAWLFRWTEHGGDRFDYYLVNAKSDFASKLFAGATEPITLERHLGNWWLYRRGSGAVPNSWLPPTR